MTTYSPTAEPRPLGWLRAPAFDLTFIVGVCAIALLSGAAVVYNPAWFGLILFVDLWVLGYHHVVSTYTRLFFDIESFREHRFLVIGLPVLVTVACLASLFFMGRWVLASAYLYWQWFHYTRQSYGIARIYGRKANAGKAVDDRLATTVIYAIPPGILYRSYQAPDRFLGMPLKVLPVPFWLVAMVGVLAVAATVVYAGRNSPFDTSRGSARRSSTCTWCRTWRSSRSPTW